MDKQANNLFPYTRETWNRLTAHLKLSPQHARVTECLFNAMGDKQIAIEMQLSMPTVRTYLDRIGKQFGVNGRIEIILIIVAAAQQIQ